jgi:signal transduction histidine kinase
VFGFVAGPDIKRLREQLVLARQTDKRCAVNVTIVHNGKRHPVELRIRRQLLGDEVGYLAVIEYAQQLRDEINPGPVRKSGGPAVHELVVNLGRAQTLSSVGETVGAYCSNTYRSPAGMIFVERDGGLQLVSQWCSRRISKKHLAEDMIKNGPVSHVFRTGESILWPQERRSRYASRYLRRLLPLFSRPSVAFVPISAPVQRPVGVLAVVLRDEEAPEARVHLHRLGQIISGCIVRARAYDESLAARAKAENANQQTEEFLSVLSHELKNPIMPILGWAVALGSGTLAVDRQNVAIDGIVRNVRALNHLIDDLFDAARISAGKLRLELGEMRIQEVVRDALAGIQQTAEDKKLRISTDISEAIPPFFADCRRVRQVLTNLLNNAVKFTPGGGSIALKVVRRRDAVECIVSDTGKGIEPSFLPFVFDRFRQENRSSKAKCAGLGLGLAIVREIVALHGGSVKAYSEGTDKGSIFILRLQLRRRRHASHSEIHPHALGSDLQISSAKMEGSVKSK